MDNPITCPCRHHTQPATCPPYPANWPLRQIPSPIPHPHCLHPGHVGTRNDVVTTNYSRTYTIIQNNSLPLQSEHTGIAQLVEHWSPKPGVGSSSLSSRARRYGFKIVQPMRTATVRNHRSGCFLFYVHRQPHRTYQHIWDDTYRNSVAGKQ